MSSQRAITSGMIEEILGEEPGYIVLKIQDRGKDADQTPYSMRLSLAKLLKEDKLSIYRTGGHYFLVIGTHETGLPLSALKTIVGLALAFMPAEDAREVVKEWYEQTYA